MRRIIGRDVRQEQDAPLVRQPHAGGQRGTKPRCPAKIAQMAHPRRRRGPTQLRRVIALNWHFDRFTDAVNNLYSSHLTARSRNPSRPHSETDPRSGPTACAARRAGPVAIGKFRRRAPRSPRTSTVDCPSAPRRAGRPWSSHSIRHSPCRLLKRPDATPLRRSLGRIAKRNCSSSWGSIR